MNSASPAPTLQKRQNGSCPSILGNKPGGLGSRNGEEEKSGVGNSTGDVLRFSITTTAATTVEGLGVRDRNEDFEKRSSVAMPSQAR